MSAKWRRIQAWDAEHLTGWLTPLRIALDWLSSIRLAVILLIFVALYAILASVPVGLLALAPTYLFYTLTVALAAALPMLVAIAVARAAFSRAGRGARFAFTMLATLGAGVLGVWAWALLAWPHLRFDPTTGAGVRFFAEFSQRYESTTVRRLPGVEMTELQFYSWWPLTGVLLLFCANLIVATIRRIEFTFKNLGVLTVHAGIITIALGTVLYARFKVEGDTILLAAPPVPGVEPQPGPTQTTFYDNTRVVLNIAQHAGMGGRPRWEQRAIEWLPRYNAYGLGAGDGARELLSAAERVAGRGPPADAGRTLDIPIPPGEGRWVDPDLVFRVVGYAPQVDLVPDWVRADPPIIGEANPLRELELYADIPPGPDGRAIAPDQPAFRFTLLPRTPARRSSDNAVLGLEYTAGADDDRWRALAAELPEGAAHGLVIALPGRDPVVVTADVGARHEIPGTDLAVTITAVHPTPPFPIITPGYEGATSPVAVVRIESGDDAFERWLYFRFPEIDQDIRGAREDGRPDRVDADRSLVDVTFVDASRLQVHFDERADGSVRAIIRPPGAPARVLESLEGDRLEDVIEGIDLALSRRWEHAELVRVPVVIPPEDQNAEDLGTHAGAALAVEITSPALAGWRRVEWVPFSRYLGVGEEDAQREVTLPDGRTVRVAFGRRQHRFPGFGVRMVDFEMIAYDHRGAPRDYQSVVRVEPTAWTDEQSGFDPYEHTVKLNAPLRAPFHWNESAPWIANAARRLVGGFSPNQFKFSQAGWDQQGWQETQAMVDSGQLERPIARFTILGVGNNPGIHVIALGSVLMSVGIPWAFYVKPWLMRREKGRLRQRAAAIPPTPPAPEPKPLEEAAV